jgi:hypothetical protein
VLAKNITLHCLRLLARIGREINSIGRGNLNQVDIAIDL